MSAAQVGFGLYGALLVEDPADGVGVADQLTLVLSDIGFDAKGVLEPADSGGSAGMVFGREGDYVLVERPDAARRCAPAPARRSAGASSTPPRAASSSSISTASRSPSSAPTAACRSGRSRRDILLITPGERVDVIVTPTGAPGSRAARCARCSTTAATAASSTAASKTLLTIAFTTEPPLPTGAAAGGDARDHAAASAAGATPVDDRADAAAGGRTASRSSASTACRSGRPSRIRATLGETQLWMVKNDTEWDHPFHLHGFFFMSLDEQGPAGAAAGVEGHGQRADEDHRRACW